MARRDADDVIEKRDPNPVTISALVIAVVAILGAMVLQIMEIAEYGKGEAQQVVASDKSDFDRTVNNIPQLSDGSDEGLGGDAEYFQVSVQEGKGCYAPYGCGISVSFDVAIRTAMKNFAKDVIAAPIRKAEMDAYDKENEEAERKAGQA